MKTIYKYQLEITDHQSLEIEGFNGFLKVADQNGNLCLWCLVNKEDKSIYTAEIKIVGTGNQITELDKIHQGSYFDSVLMGNGLVWHVFLIN